MRLDKLLADLGRGSRREVTALVRRGAVTVDAVVVRDPARHVDPRSMGVAVDGVALVWRSAHHRLLNKPAGTVTSTVDHDGPPVVALLDEPHLPWMPVGRLDRDTEGLLLLTTDGELAHRLTHPRWKVDKTYEATLAAPATAEDVAAFRDGLPLGDERLLPAELAWDADPAQVRVVLREGRYHQVKRMFVARGNRVLSLRRVAFGPLSLPAELAAGEARPLTAAEEQAVYAAVGLQGEL